MMEVVVTTGAMCAKLQSGCRHQHTNTQFLQIRCTDWKKYHIQQTFSPQAHLGSSILVVTTEGSRLPWEGCHASSSFWCQYPRHYV